MRRLIRFAFLYGKRKKIVSAIHPFSISKIIICLLILSQSISAQYRFDSWTTDNGLPQNGVRSITQTSDGYLWFTTFDGLVRFDGARFTVFDKNNSKGILSNRFFLLHVEPDGTLFAGTEDGGFTVYRNGAFKTYTTADGLPSNSITFFRTDINGEFVVDTIGGACYFRDGKFVRVPASAFPNNALFYRSPTGNLWLYGKDGVRQITPDKREINYPIKIDYFNDNYTGIKLFEDRKGNLWFGDVSGVYSLKDGNVIKLTAKDGMPNTFLRPFLEDDDGGIWFSSGWFGYTGVGLVRYYKGQFSNWGKDIGLSNLIVGLLFKDSEGTIWAATEHGLNHLRKQFIKSFSTGDGLPFPEVYPLLQTRNGDIYIGTVQGLSRFRDGKFTNVVTKDKDKDIYISASALHEDESGGMWIGAAGVLYKLENEKLRQIHSFNNLAIWAISNDNAGNLWVGSSNGLMQFKDEKLIAHFTVKEGLPGNDVKIIHKDRKGNLWLGTYGGLARIADCRLPTEGAANCQIKTYTTKDGLASDRVRTIYEDDSGTLWIGTYDGGLSRFKDGKFFSYTVENGLFNNGVFHIIEDDKNNFWISCNKGIFRVSKEELNDFADGKISKINSVAYGKQDGMLNTECNGGRQPAGIKTNDGKFWFPTQDGVVVINPNEFSINPNPPPVEIENVLVERQSTNFQNGITLKAHSDNLQINFTGINFTKPEQVKFRYRIEGLEENWIDVGTIRELYFPSLPSGEYTFHIIAANSDGVWNMEGARLKISVLAPFWQKAWFIVSVSLAVILVIFVVFRFRVKELKRRELVQQEFSRKLLSSQEQERQRIAAELHDSIGQSLLIIKNRAYIALSDLDQRESVKEQLEELSDSAAGAIEECREISYNLRPYQISNFGLTRTLEAIFRRISEISETKTLTEIEPIDDLFNEEEQTNIYRIIQESVNNIIKHSDATEAKLIIKKHDRYLEILIQDDGRGFKENGSNPNQNKRSGFGLIGIAERVRMLAGSYEINSQPGHGTSIRIRIEEEKGRKGEREIL